MSTLQIPVALHLTERACALLSEAINTQIQDIRACVTRSPHSTRGSRKAAGEDIATLQTIARQIKEQQPRTTLIDQHNLGVLTLMDQHSHIKFKRDLLKLWDDNEEFILNLDRTSYKVRRTDYVPGTEIRFEYKYPPTRLNHKA